MANLSPSISSNISFIVKKQAQHFPNAVAIITPEVKLTYLEFEQHITRYAHLLREFGIRAGDRIALIISDERVLLTTLLAAARLSAPVMLIPRSTSLIQRSELMSSAKVRFLVADSEKEMRDHTCQTPIEAKWLESAELNSEIKIEPNTDFDPHQTIFIIVIGSGTTGRQKLIPITHAQMRSRALCLSKNLKVTSQDRLAIMSHVEYAGGIHRLLSALFCGAGFVIFNRQRNDLQEWKDRYGLTILSATPFHAHQMLREVRKKGKQSIRPLDGIDLSVSSSVVTQELRKTILAELCANLRVNYGTNEAWLVTTAETEDLLQHPGTVGRTLPGVTVEILDHKFQPLPVGQTGLIAIKSDQVIGAYLGDEEATQKAFRDGWFIPGDLGHFTYDGQLIFCGRSDNMMIFNGINIFPIEIEQCLLSHSSVADVVAMPLRHVIHHDFPVAVVALKKDANITEDRLQQYAANLLGPKQPRRIIITQEIPRNSQGKPIKIELVKIIYEAFS